MTRNPRSHYRPDELQEIERQHDWESGDVSCRGCGKYWTLWYNGGELDYHMCCGYVYQTEHGPIDLVVYRVKEPSDPPHR